MPRKPRSCPAGFVYHVWNRAAGRLRFFKKDSDYIAFEKVLVAAHHQHRLPILDWCLMPNHWHFVVQPDTNEQVTAFFKWLTHTHSMRWHSAKNAVGIGPLYQGRFKTLPVQEDEHLLTLLRYVDRNPLRAKLVKRAENWRFGAEHIRQHGPPELRDLLNDWPIARPRNWSRWLNELQTDAELQSLRQCIKRSRPIGNEKWVAATAKQMKLEWTIHPRGRPRSEKALRPL